MPSGCGASFQPIRSAGNRRKDYSRPLPHPSGSIDPLLRRVTFAYDDGGNKILKLDPRGNRATYLYDQANRVIAAAQEKGAALKCRERSRTLEYFNGANPSIGIQMSAPRQTQAVKRIEGVI